MVRREIIRAFHDPCPLLDVPCNFIQDVVVGFIDLIHQIVIDAGSALDVHDLISSHISPSSPDRHQIAVYMITSRASTVPAYAMGVMMSAPFFALHV
jgi:hypothetical protein